MDEYLIPTANSNRLIKEYKQYGSVVVAFDFDNTVFDYHKKGHTYPLVIGLLRELKEIGCSCICFTAAEDYEMITQYCKDNDIPLDGINTNPPFFTSTSPKIYFNALLDDRAGLISAYHDLRALINYVTYYGLTKQ